MGLFSWGRGSRRTTGTTAGDAGGSAAHGADEQAIARYRYMLRTAPPETIEQAHAEAFAQLTPEQRRKVLDGMSAELPQAERETVLREGATPASLARAATRAEVRRPGAMERTFGGMGGGPGLGGLMAGTMLSSMAGMVLGSVIAQHFLADDAAAAPGAGDDASGDGMQTAEDAGSEFSEGGFDDGGSFDV